MRIAILTMGRFHVCDLARELDALGHEVAFYSLVPPWRTRTFGLPNRCNRWLAPYLALPYALSRLVPGSPLAQRALIVATDAVAARVIEPCDVFIGMSQLCLSTMERVRRKYGCKVFIERGSRHILSQRAVLQAVRVDDGSPVPVPDFAVHRELAEYALADFVVVPARHVVRSFTERGIPEERLFCNPYGVDLAMFPATPAPPSEPSRVIMVGSWSIRKGCDVLANAMRRLDGVRLLHVGAIVDCPRPSESWFEHHDSVPQSRLTEFYAQAHVAVLASREEGLSMVQAQALASGLPLVCTDRTGGEDLGEFIDDRSTITVVPHDDSGALGAALRDALARARHVTGIRDQLGENRSALSWKAYGARYSEKLAACRGRPGFDSRLTDLNRSRGVV